MKMDLYQNEFTEYANKNEQNLQVAILAGLSFQELRGKLIDEFEAELRNRLSKNGWSRDSEKGKTWSKTYWAKFRKKDWPEHVYVGIGPNSNFSQHDFGVIANLNEIEFDKELRIKLSEHLYKWKVGSVNNHCAWVRKLETSYANLNSEKGLMAISKFQWESALTDLIKEIDIVGDKLDLFLADWLRRNLTYARR